MSDLGSAQQENFLALLTHDDKAAAIIRNSVDLAMFGSIYRHVARQIYDFIDRYKKAPKDHLPDLVEDKLKSESKRERDLYRDIVENILDMGEKLNVDYVLSQLRTFVERQSLRSMAVELHPLLQSGDEEDLEKARGLLEKVRRSNLTVFDPGTRLSNAAKALAFLDERGQAFATGIRELDKRGFGPTRKEVILLIGDTKAGKTQWLIHVSKLALMQHLNVLHVSLEMSEAKVAQRYMQSFWSITKRKEKIEEIIFRRDKRHYVTGFEEVEFMPLHSFEDADIEKFLRTQIKKWSTRVLDNILIKQFPMGQLTMPGLISYMDNLEASEKFVPDMVVLDYPDLMKTNADNLRGSLDAIYKDFRGLMVARNMAGVVVSQSHRAAAKAKHVGREHVAEAYSKIQHADLTLSYSQTPQEKKIHLARITVEAGRNDEAITVIVSQRYAAAQFAIDSALMIPSYWREVNDLVPMEQPQEKK